MTAPADDLWQAEHLGPCDVCDQPVRAATECPMCLEEEGTARHDRCCELIEQ